MKDFLNIPLLEQLYKFKEAEMGRYSVLYNKEFQEVKEKNEQKEKEIFSKLKKFISNENDLKTVENIIEECKGNVAMEGYISGKDYYKFGFFDGINFIKDVRRYKNTKNVDSKENLMDKCIEELLQYIEDEIKKALNKREDYVQIKNRVNQIKEQYSNIQKYVVDEEITELSNDELKVLLEFIKLTDEMKSIEAEENFKFGLREKLIA